jgi:hypothetical protein
MIQVPLLPLLLFNINIIFNYRIDSYLIFYQYLSTKKFILFNFTEVIIKILVIYRM